MRAVSKRVIGEMKTKILIIIFALFLLLLTACSPQKSSGDAITANVVAEKSQGVASQSSPASVIGNIEHKKEKESGVNAEIISSELLSNEKLKVNFRHNSNKNEIISINGHVKYSLQKSTASPGEDIELTVDDWSTEYFELQVGEDKFSFGKKAESLGNDEVVLKELAKQGIDKKDVVLERDYAPRSKGKDYSPFSKIYKDTKSGKSILVASGLPMVDDAGMPIDAGWEQQGQSNRFTEKNNLFKATVNGNNVELIVKNDQPDGRKKNDKLTFNAQLFLNGVEQTATGPILLAIDPVNSNYQNNVLEWDYGIAKRRLRIIEGSILGSWVFPTNPNGEVRIKYNQVGNYRLKLGQYANGTDEELVPASVFTSATYPFTVSDSATYNPNADPETTSVDGRVRREGTNLAWADVHDGAGTMGESGAISSGISGFWFGTSSGNYNWLIRTIVLFDTSNLPDNADISGAVLSLYGASKADEASNAPAINIYSSNPASNTDLAAADYGTLGTTAFSTAITYASWSTTGYNDFTLNAGGLTAISKTGVSKFGARESNFDAVNSAPPTWSSQAETTLRSKMSEDGAGFKPKLAVTYTVPQPIINGTLNKSITTIFQNDVINATFNMTDGSGSINGTIVINNTGIKRYFNFSFINYVAGNTQQMSQNFTISEIGGTVINITGIAIGNASNRAQNETIFTVVKWASTSFDRCKNITIYNNGTTALSNFPAYVNLTYDSDMLSNYQDLRFYGTSCSNGGSTLDYEIENYTASNAHVWVRIPTLSTGTNNISVYYKNNTNIGSGQNAPGVWDSNYKGVWHLNANGTIATNDSTSNNNHGTNVGATLNTTGKVDGAGQFDGVNDYVDVPDSANWNINAGDFAISLWFNAAAITAGISYDLVAQSIDNNYRWHFTIDNVGGGITYLYMTYKNGDNTAPNRMDVSGTTNLVNQINKWYYVVATKSGNDWTLYLNGVVDGSATDISTTWSDFAHTLEIGGITWTSTRYFNGTIDEVRISNTTRTADWINTTYKLIANQSSYVSFGSEQQQTATDTCTYSSGDWNIAASDNCAISTANNLGGNDLVCSGTGTLDIGTNGKISNFGTINLHGGCNLICRNTAGCFG